MTSVQPSTSKSTQRSPQAGLLSDYTGPPSKLLAERLILSDISADSDGTADSDLALTNPETRRIYYCRELAHLPILNSGVTDANPQVGRRVQHV